MEAYMDTDTVKEPTNSKYDTGHCAHRTALHLHLHAGAAMRARPLRPGRCVRSAAPSHFPDSDKCSMRDAATQTASATRLRCGLWCPWTRPPNTNSTPKCEQQARRIFKTKHNPTRRGYLPPSQRLQLLPCPTDKNAAPHRTPRYSRPPHGSSAA